MNTSVTIIGPTVCPTIGGQTPISQNSSCTYNSSAFIGASYANMQTIQEYRNQTNPTDYNNAFYDYCFQSVTANCPINPTTDLTMLACSRVTSTGQEGDLCKSWLSSLPSTTHDDDIISYCSSTWTPDCACAIPQPADLYDELSAGTGLSNAPQCWWVPCEIQSGQFLIPSTYTNRSNCPSSTAICETVINYVEDNDLDASAVATYTGCASTTEKVSNFFDQYWWIFFILGSIIVIGIIYALYRSHSQYLSEAILLGAKIAV